MSTWFIVSANRLKNCPTSPSGDDTRMIGVKSLMICLTIYLFIYLFIYLYNFANEQTAHYIHKYRQLAGYTLQLAPITAALFIII